MKIPDSWPIFALMLFAVVSGQVGRLGSKYERGVKIGRKQIVIEMTMLPAFGALGGALAADQNWPMLTILAVGVSAGWTGFGTFRLIATVTRVTAQQVLGLKSETPPAEG